MIIKTMWILNSLSCGIKDLYITSKISEIDSIFETCTFLKDFIPKYYNFEKNFEHKNLILHYKNLISKITDLELINCVQSEYLENKDSFKTKIICCNVNIELIYSFLSEHFDRISIFFKIEINLYMFLYKKINEICCLELNDLDFLNLIDKDIQNLNFLIKHIRNFKIYRFHSKIKISYDQNEILVFEEILGFLNNKVDCIKDNFFRNKILTESYGQYLEELKAKLDLDFNSACNLLSVNSMKDRKDLAHKSVVIVKGILKQNINLDSMTFFSEIQENLNNIYILLYIISKTSFIDFNIYLFVDIYLYISFLSDIIFLKYNMLEKNFKSLEILESTSQFKIQKLYKVLMSLILQKKYLSNLVRNYIMSCFEKLIKERFFKSNIEKYCIINYFLTIDNFYDDLKENNFLEVYCKQKYLKIMITRNKILRYLKNNFKICLMFFFNDFDVFKFQCILLLKLSSLYLCTYKSYKQNCNLIFFKLLKMFIEYFKSEIKEDEEVDEESSHKYIFLKEINVYFMKINESLEIFLKNRNTKNKQQDIGNILFSELELQKSFYEIVNKISLSQALPGCETNKIWDSKISEIINISKKHIESVVDYENVIQNKTCLRFDNKRYSKPKTYWKKCWENDEKNLLKSNDTIEDPKINKLSHKLKSKISQKNQPKNTSCSKKRRRSRKNVGSSRKKRKIN
ncbi:hypothetical protein NUSPORA_00894 [Nucleospora cyclopteri]